MKPLGSLAKDLKSNFKEMKDFGLYDFLNVENVLYLMSIISPDLNPRNAYVLLRGYQIINHREENEKLFLLQQSRIKFMVYSSRMQWEQKIEKYLDQRYSGIRLYEVEGDKLVKTQKSIPIPNREEMYLANLKCSENKKTNLPSAQKGKYKLYRHDKSSVTVDIPELPNDLYAEVEPKSLKPKLRRKRITISYDELLNSALEMKGIADDYCYSRLQENTLECVKKESDGDGFTIEGVTNVVGMVGSGKTVLLKVLCFYLAKHGYRTVIVMNTVSDVVDIYKYLKQFNLSVSPLVGKSSQEKYVFSLLKNEEAFIDEDIAKYLATPCILNGLSDESKEAWQYGERPCYGLRSCDSNDKNKSRLRCKFYDFCPGAAMSREAERSDIVVTTVAGIAASLVGKNHRLFLEEMIEQFDVVMFDECDRVQATLDDFFAPNTCFNDFMQSQSDSCAYDMRKNYIDVDRDRNERKFFTLARETTEVYDEIVADIIKLAEGRGKWKKVISSTFSALTLLRQLEIDGIDARLINALNSCINVLDTNTELANFTSQLSEICDDSCRADSHIHKRLKRLLEDEILFGDNKIELSDNDFQHVLLILKVIYFDRLMHRIDNAAKSVDKEILWSNNISDFLQARFVTQQKYLPSAPMGNMFGMMCTDSKELKVYKQYACGRYLMLSMPWLRVNECGEPLGPHAVLMSGSSYAPGSLQYHVNAPVDYVLKAPPEITEYLNKSFFQICGATTVISGGGQEGRGERLKTLLREIRQHIEAELDRTGKLLFVVNSYREAAEVMHHTKSLLMELNRQEKCAVVIGDDEERKESGMLRKSDLQSFAYREERILIAPATVISRGYNIVDKNGNSVIRSIFFLVRPMPVPDDISLKISKLNGYISHKFSSCYVDDWGKYANEIKNKGGKFWSVMERDGGSGLANLSDENKRDITATVFISVEQTYGRASRVGDREVIDKYPPRIYFADGAFNSGRGDGSFDILKEICAYLEELMIENENVATTLYGTFYNALKEIINNGSTKEITDDDVPTEDFHD